MIVCKTNPQARELYRLWQERFGHAQKVSEQNEAEIAIAAEPMLFHKDYKPLTASLILHDEGDKMERKEYIEGFKKLQEVDILIVNKMLLTGFDAPRLKKLYLGRSLTDMTCCKPLLVSIVLIVISSMDMWLTL